jgi:predicted nucleotidyltransferase
MLKERYGATRVVVFGSLARGDFTLGSDIDLAAWDVDPKRYYEAVARILDLGQDVVDPGGGFRIDVLPAEDVFAPLLATIQRDGVEV